jgi:hypothetical protein
VRRILAHPALEEFTLPADNRGRQNLEFSQLERKKRVLGKFRDQLLKLGAGHFCFFLAQGRQRQHDFGKRPEIMAALGGDLELLDPCFLVAWIPAKPSKSC